MSTAAEVESNLRMALAEVGADHLLLSVGEEGRWSGFNVRWKLGARGLTTWRAMGLDRMRRGEQPRCWACTEERHAALHSGAPEPPECEAFGRLIEDCGRPRCRRRVRCLLRGCR